MIVNFFWRGNNFQFLNRLTVLSHVRVGHKVVVWLSGEEPKNKYWISDIKEVSIKNADKFINVDKFLQKGNVRTASSLWRFTYLYEYGGLYCDTDMIALKPFPDDKWILATYDKKVIATGVIKAPPKHKVFKSCLDQIKHSWGNVWIFTRECKKNGLKVTHPNSDFYPWGCKSGPNLLKKIDIPDGYGLHFYFNSACDLEIDHITLRKHRGSLLGKLQERIFRNYPEINNDFS
jgi:hypothetical protein